MNIIIIGGGLSGFLLAWNILRHADGSKDINLKIIDNRPETGLGAAYSTTEDCHLLNVAVERMGADPHNPRHFFNWVINNGIPVKDGDFMPRNLFRKYIQELFQGTLISRKNNVSFERLQGEATGVKIQNNHAVLTINNDHTLQADKVVLAIGNFPPKNLPLKNNSYLTGKRYFNDPWKQNLFNSLKGNESVLMIGTGQTTIDLIVSLYLRRHKGKITAISRHGFFPLVHKNMNEFPSFYSEIINTKSVLEIFRIIRKKIALAEQTGSDMRAVIDSMRPYTNELWLGLPVDEKKRFLRHLFRYWEIIRSRMAPVNEKIIREAEQNGQLKIESGRITDISDNNDSLEVLFQNRGSSNEQMVKADLAVNCTGPRGDYSCISDPLVQNMMEQDLMSCDPLHLGINANPDGSLITKNGKASTVFYTIGPPLRGVLWECVAVPDIKILAENLALKLLKNG